MTDYGELTVPQLVEMISTEYGVIVEAERSNLQRAISIGEKLLDLKLRVAKHGEWQQWLKDHCPKISIETANLYMRLAGNVDKLEKAAAAKSVSLTDLSITDARQLLAKPKSEADEGTGSSKPRATKAAVEPAMDPEPGSLPPDEVVMNLELDYGDMFETLKSKYDQDELMELTKLLAAYLGMTLMPISQSKALYEAIGLRPARCRAGAI
jgi:hypothetical protein